MNIITSRTVLQFVQVCSLPHTPFLTWQGSHNGFCINNTTSFDWKRVTGRIFPAVLCRPQISQPHFQRYRRKDTNQLDNKSHCPQTVVTWTLFITSTQNNSTCHVGWSAINTYIRLLILEPLRHLCNPISLFIVCNQPCCLWKAYYISPTLVRPYYWSKEHASKTFHKSLQTVIMAMAKTENGFCPYQLREQMKNCVPYCYSN